MELTKLILSFRSKQQLPLFMVVKEHYKYNLYENKEEFYAEIIFQIQ